MSPYVVDIKPSARRANGAVGTLICRQGAVHRFESREAAAEWAESLSAEGNAHVWIRDADPRDSDDVNGYLVSRSSWQARGDARGRQVGFGDVLVGRG